MSIMLSHAISFDNVNDMHNPSPPIRSILKSKIQSIHDETEKNSFMKGFMSANLTREMYFELLTKLFQSLAPIEGIIKQSKYLHLFPSVEERIYFHALQDEISGYNSATLTNVNHTHNHSKAFLAGMLYALEGSAMGGSVIYKKVHYAGENGYFHSQFHFASRRFLKFIEELESELSESDIDEAFSGAKFIFDNFNR